MRTTASCNEAIDGSRLSARCHPIVSVQIGLRTLGAEAPPAMAAVSELAAAGRSDFR